MVMVRNRVVRQGYVSGQLWTLTREGGLKADRGGDLRARWILRRGDKDGPVHEGPLASLREGLAAWGRLTGRASA